MSKLRIQMEGGFYGHHSLSIVNRNLFLQLIKNEDIWVSIRPNDAYDPDARLSKNLIRTIKEYEKKDFWPDIILRHSYPPNWEWPEPKLNDTPKLVYVQPWEFLRMPSEWEYKFSTFADAVIVPSEWTRKVYKKSGINPDKVFTIPNGYDPLVFNFKPEISQFYNNKRFTFVFVGSSQYRKGLDLALNAWSKAFIRADNVQLYIVDNIGIYGDNNVLEEITKLQYKGNVAKIIYNNDVLTPEELANIYKNAFALLHPYRGESFGMHIQEAIMCGAIPLITKGGAADEFIPDNFSVKIDSQLQPVNLSDSEIFAIKPGDSLANMGAHSFLLEPSLSSLVDGMRLIYQHHFKKDLQKKIKKKYENNNTWKNVTEQYIEAFTKIIKKERTMRSGL